MFTHAGNANEAFKQLPGAHEKDSLGRAQKLLKLTSGGVESMKLHPWSPAALPHDVQVHVLGTIFNFYQAHNWVV